MGFILSIVAYLLFPIVAVGNFFIVMYKNIHTYGFFKSMNHYWLRNAVEVDRIGNYHFRTFLNTTFIKKEGYKFGNIDETISSVIGKNEVLGTLSWFGWFINIILWIVDYKYWFKGGHSKNSIGV